MLPPAVTRSVVRAASARSIIPLSRAWAPASSPGTNAVSGMFFQYFFGISFSIAPILTRAGLKIAA